MEWLELPQTIVDDAFSKSVDFFQKEYAPLVTNCFNDYVSKIVDKILSRNLPDDDNVALEKFFLDTSKLSSCYVLLRQHVIQRDYANLTLHFLEHFAPKSGSYIPSPWEGNYHFNDRTITIVNESWTNPTTTVLFVGESDNESDGGENLSSPELPRMKVLGKTLDPDHFIKLFSQSNNKIFLQENLKADTIESFAELAHRNGPIGKSASDLLHIVRDADGPHPPFGRQHATFVTVRDSRKSEDFMIKTLPPRTSPCASPLGACQNH